MREFARRFYNSKEWARCRTSYRQSVHGLCERCSLKGLIVAGKIVHHKVYLNEQNIHDPNITLNFEHLEFLCQDCHNEEHMGADVVENGLYFDSVGRLIQR